MLELAIQFVLLINLIACAVLAVQVFAYISQKPVKYFLGLIGLHFIWCFSALMILSVNNPEVMIFFAKFKYLSITLIAPSTVGFVCGIFFEKTKFFQSTLKYIIWVIPFFCFLIVVNPWTQNLFVSNLDVIKVYGVETVRWQDGPFFKLHYLHSILLMLTGYSSLIYMRIKGGEKQKRQANALMLGSAWIVIFDLLIVTQGWNLRWFNHGAIVCLPLLLSYSYVIRRYDFIDLFKLAKDSAFNQVPSPIFVYDSEFNLQFKNFAAEQDITPESIFLAKEKILLLDQDCKTLEFELHAANAKWKVNSRKIYNNRRHHGYIIIFQDVTAEVEANENLIELNEMKKKTFSVLAHDIASNLSGLDLLTSIANKNIRASDIDSAQKNLENIREGIKASKETLNSLLDWIRKEKKR